MIIPHLSSEVIQVPFEGCFACPSRSNSQNAYPLQLQDLPARKSKHKSSVFHCRAILSRIPSNFVGIACGAMGSDIRQCPLTVETLAAPLIGETDDARFRGKLLKGDPFYWLRGARISTEEGRRYCNSTRSNCARCYEPPAPATIFQMDRATVMRRRAPWISRTKLFRTARSASGPIRCYRS